MEQFSATTAAFVDLAGYWGQTAIQALVQRQLINGYPDGTFRPNGQLSRAEFAALLYKTFADTVHLDPDRERPGVIFQDIPSNHWAKEAIQWSVDHRFFSGYDDQTFRPNESLSRAQALVVLSSGLRLGSGSIGAEILPIFFDDAEAVPDYFQGAIATATLNRLVVNYPHVRQLRPQAAITRGEVAVVLAQALRLPEVVPSQYVAWSLRLEWLADPEVEPKTISLNQLRNHPGLLHQIQAHLATLGLYPASQIDGVDGPKTQGAIAQFAQQFQLSTSDTQVIDHVFAAALLNAKPTDTQIDKARDRDALFQHFFEHTKGASAAKLPFLYRGIQQSPYRRQIVAFPDRLKERPDGQDVVVSSLPQQWAMRPYPAVGERPVIYESGLSFLHSDIKQACVCVGQWRDGQMTAQWLGRNAMKPIELWSTTKLVPILNVVTQSNRKFPGIDIDECQIRQKGNVSGFDVHALAEDIMSYDQTIGTSNAIAAMMKLFETPLGLENWLKSITGHQALEFRGRYGEPPFLNQPELWHPSTGKVILKSNPIPQWKSNTIAVYDLTRLISMVGWHLHLPANAKLPGVQWNSLESVVRAMGSDAARYAEVAIDQLGLESVVRSPVIISKLGYGRTSIRDRAEFAYTALVQFVDKRPNASGHPSVMHSMAFTLLSSKDYGNFDKEAVELDARMATEVTDLIRRLIQSDWA